MTKNEPLFLETVTPTVRRLLISERLDAMRGNISTVLPRFAQYIYQIQPNKTHDIVALGLLKAELLHLDSRPEEGLEVYKSVRKI